MRVDSSEGMESPAVCEGRRIFLLGGMGTECGGARQLKRAFGAGKRFRRGLPGPADPGFHEKVVNNQSKFISLLSGTGGGEGFVGLAVNNEIRLPYALWVGRGHGPGAGLIPVDRCKRDQDAAD
jgi:hypothetical protein